MTKEQSAIEELVEYANESTCYLSNAEGYARGYKEGVEMVKKNMRSILVKYGFMDQQDYW